VLLNAACKVNRLLCGKNYSLVRSFSFLVVLYSYDSIEYRVQEIFYKILQLKLN
jgi:hypothetical protein